MTPKATVSELRQRIIDRCAPGNSSRRTDLKKLLDAYREAAVMAERASIAKKCDEMSTHCHNVSNYAEATVWNDARKMIEALRTDPPGTVRGESE